MKIRKRVLLVNFLLLILIFVGLEIYSYNYMNNFRYFDHYVNKQFVDLGMVRMPVYKTEPIYEEIYQRNYDKNKFNRYKKPILFIGCSYTYGLGIKIPYTFASQVQRYTGRKTNTVAYLGASPEECLKWLNYMWYFGKFKEEGLKYNEYEYCVYTWMSNHYQRVNMDVLSRYLTKKLYENKDKSFKDSLKYYLDKLYFFKMVRSRYFMEKPENIMEYHKFIIKRCREIVHINSPKTKFVFLIYNNLKPTEDMENLALQKETWDDLKEDGTIILSTQDLVGDILREDRYQLAWDPFVPERPYHPNAKAWSVIVPAFCKKLKL